MTSIRIGGVLCQVYRQEAHLLPPPPPPPPTTGTHTTAEGGHSAGRAVIRPLEEATIPVQEETLRVKEETLSVQ